MAKSTTSVQENFKLLQQHHNQQQQQDEALSRLLTGNETTRRGVRSIEDEINIARRKGRRKVESNMMREEQILRIVRTTTTKASITSKFRTFENRIANKPLLILIMLAQIFVACSASEESSEIVKGE